MGLKSKFALCAFTAVAALIWQIPGQPIVKAVAGSALGPDARVSGTVWNGQVVGAPGLGPINYRLNPSRFFKGRAPLDAATAMQGINISGSAGRGKLMDLNFTGQVWTFSNVDSRLAGLKGEFSAQINRLDFDSSNPAAGCTHAQGVAKTNALAANRAQWSWAGPKLEGPISCEAGALVIAMTGQEAGQTVSLTFKALPDGRYESRADIQSRDPLAQNVMALLGFNDSGDRYTLNETGRWQ